MPRETIRMNKGDDDPNVFDIKVGWEKDRHIQIGLEEAYDRSLAWTLFESKVERIGEEIYRAIGDGVLSDRVEFENMAEKITLTETNRPPTNEELGKLVLNILDIVTNGPVAGIWTTPSRHEVNELIRVLRRARDSAFGRDE